MPPPLNTIVSPKFLLRFFKGVFHFFTCFSSSQKRANRKRHAAVTPYPPKPPHSPPPPAAPHQANHTSRRNRWSDSRVEPTIRLPSSVDTAVNTSNGGRNKCSVDEVASNSPRETDTDTVSYRCIVDVRPYRCAWRPLHLGFEHYRPIDYAIRGSPCQRICPLQQFCELFSCGDNTSYHSRMVAH